MVSVVLCSFLILWYSCAGVKSATITLTPKNFSKIGISKHPCFGTCPVYNILIQKNGEALLKANANLKTGLKGEYRSVLSSREIKQVIEALQHAGFFSLQDSYGDKAVSDLPSTDIEVELLDGTKKNVHDYGNKGTTGLQQLYEVIDSIVNNKKWKTDKED